MEEASTIIDEEAFAAAFVGLLLLGHRRTGHGARRLRLVPETYIVFSVGPKTMGGILHKSLGWKCQQS
jgi:hypothetical protein